MALFKTDQANAAYPQCLMLAGAFVCPATPATNQQVLPSALALGQPGTALPQMSNTISPAGLRVNVFALPFRGAGAPASNISPLPNGMVGGGSPAGQFVIDCSSYPADIVNATANLVPQVYGSFTQQCDVSVVDTVNKLVYVQVYAATTGAAQTATAGAIVHFQVTFKDTIGV